MHPIVRIGIGLVVVAAIGYFRYVGMEGSHRLVNDHIRNTDCRTPIQLGVAYEALNYDIATDTQLAAREPDMDDCSAPGASPGDKLISTDGVRVDGPLQEFKSGTGLVAIHGAIPVIPMRLKVHRHSRIDIDTPGTGLRGDVEVIFGAPLSFPIDADPTRATDEIRAAVEAL